MKSFFEKTDKAPFVIKQTQHTANTIVYLPMKNNTIGYCFQTKRFLPEEMTQKEQEHFRNFFQQVFQSTLEEYGQYLEAKEFLAELHQEQMEELLSFSCQR